MATALAAPSAGGGPEDLPLQVVGRPDQHRKKMARLGWMFTAPALIFIGAVTLFPIGFAVLLSFEHVNVTGSGFQLTGMTVELLARPRKLDLALRALLHARLHVRHGRDRAGHRHDDRARARAA